MNKQQYNRYIELCKKFYTQEEFLEWLHLTVIKYNLDLTTRRLTDPKFSFLDKVLEDSTNI